MSLNSCAFVSLAVASTLVAAERPRLIIQHAEHRLILAMSFSHDGTMLATIGGRSSIKIWSMRSHGLYQELGVPGGGYYSLCFSTDDRILAVRDQGIVRRWDVHTGMEL